MSVRRLRRIVDAYGGAPARWPAVERADALAVLHTTDEGRRADAARGLDRVLDVDAAHAADMPVSRDLLTPAVLRARDAWSVRGRGVRPARRGPGFMPAAFAASAVAGLALGLLVSATEPTQGDPLDRIPAAAASGVQIERLAVSMLETRP